MTDDELNIECAKIERQLCNYSFCSPVLQSSLMQQNREAIKALCQRMQVEGLREAAYMSDTFSKGYDIDWWREQTKSDIANTLCRDVAEKIRERAEERERWKEKP